MFKSAERGDDVSGRRRPPQARDRVLGARLRALRMSHTDLGVEEAARAAQVSSATLSRTENGKRHITVEDVAVLCTLYGVPPAQRSALVEAVQAPAQAGWWELPPPGVPLEFGTLASYESVAVALTDWALTMIPGLLQTRAYAMALLAASGMKGAALEGHWDARQRRQDVLPKVDYVAYIHEFALCTPFGGVQALKEQLTHLLRAQEQGAGIRVVRAGAPLGALTHSWMLLEFSKDEPIVHIELMSSAVYLHVPVVASYEEACRGLARSSLSVAESLRMIESLVERL